MRYVARALGVDRNLLRQRLHKLKAVYGLGGAERVTICLDNGLVYVSASEDEIGDLYDP
jgi:hypothetical protein